MRQVSGCQPYDLRPVTASDCLPPFLPDFNFRCPLKCLVINANFCPSLLLFRTTRHNTRLNRLPSVIAISHETHRVGTVTGLDRAHPHQSLTSRAGKYKKKLYLNCKLQVSLPMDRIQYLPASLRHSRAEGCRVRGHNLNIQTSSILEQPAGQPGLSARRPPNRNKTHH